MKDTNSINESISDSVARVTALAMKRRVISKSRIVRSTDELEKKIDELSKQVSALAGLVMLGISIGGNGLLSKSLIVSGLFTEEFSDDIENQNTRMKTSFSDALAGRDSKTEKKIRAKRVKNWISRVKKTNVQSGHSRRNKGF